MRARTIVILGTGGLAGVAALVGCAKLAADRFSSTAGEQSAEAPATTATTDHYYYYYYSTTDDHDAHDHDTTATSTDDDFQDEEERTGATPSCLNPQGEPVDFFYAFKFPRGFDYAYADPHTDMMEPAHPLDHRDSAVSRTLAAVYSSSAKIGHVLWSDQHPDGKAVGAPYAHMKGGMAFSSSGGFWLTHSLPEFAGTTKGAMWEEGSPNYGQAFLCVSLTRATIEKLSDLMIMDRPSLYDVKLGAALAKLYPLTKSWAVQKEHKPDEETIELAIRTRGGQAFTVFGKNAAFGEDQAHGEDVYAALVAPKLGNLIAEVWRHGAGNFPAACAHGIEVDDATNLKLLSHEWKATQDHSKWAVTKDGKWLCVGDVNRATGQLHRGGGTWCTKTPHAKTMRAAIVSHDECAKNVLV